MNTTAPPLAGRRVLVTRPAAQAAATARAIEAAGGEARCFPLIEITPAADLSALEALMADLDRFALAFFVSPNAVSHALDYLLARRAWPPGLRVAGVGQGTARALAACGFPDVIVPSSGFDSEAVLALPEFSRAAVEGREVVIFRGDGGRELLAEELRARGARVRCVSCYRRLSPAGGAARLLAEAAECEVLSLSSSEAVGKLLALCGGTLPEALAALPVLASHPRIAAAAQAAGFREVLACPPGDQGLVAGLSDYFRQHPGGRPPASDGALG